MKITLRHLNEVDEATSEPVTFTVILTGVDKHDTSFQEKAGVCHPWG